MEIAILNNYLAARCDKHTSCAIVSNDIVSENEVGVSVNVLDIVANLDVGHILEENETNHILIEIFCFLDRLFSVGNKRIDVDYLNFIAVAVDLDAL